MRFYALLGISIKCLFNAHKLGEEHKKRKITIQNFFKFGVQSHRHRQVHQDIKGPID